MKKIGWAFTCLCLAFLAVLLFPGKASAAAAPAASEGVYIENVNVSGMTEEEIAQAVNDKISELQQETVLLYVNGTPVSVTAGELGLTYTNPEVIHQALSVGRQGNVLKRFQVERYHQKYGPLVFELKLAVTAETVQSVIEEKCVPQGYPAVNLGLVHNSDGSFSTTEKKDGISVKVDESVSKVVNYMNTEWHGGLGGVSVEIEVLPAQGDEAQMALVQNVLGSGSTQYDPEQTSRSTNIAVGASKLNGRLMYPGEELSVSDAMAPYTAEAGYLPATSIEMGSYVDSYGGGICQVSTTLYRAVLEAELEVTERSNHSLLVGYVEPSMDAAIAEGIKDFKFVNNTDAPIYIEGYAGGGEIYFSIYGHETRDPARSIAFESETLSTVDATVEITADAEADFGKLETEPGHSGSTAEVWKVISVNGEVQSREQVNYSEYQMIPTKYKVGTKGASTAALQAITKAIASGDIAKVQQVIAEHPGGA